MFVGYICWCLTYFLGHTTEICFSVSQVKNAKGDAVWRLRQRARAAQYSLDLSGNST